MNRSRCAPIERLVHVAAHDRAHLRVMSMISQKSFASRNATPSSHVLPIGNGW